MLKDSDFIIFDEPTNNLDKESVELFINQLNSIRGQKTVLIITHSNTLENISDLVFELKGKLVKIANYLSATILTDVSSMFLNSLCLY